MYNILNPKSIYRYLPPPRWLEIGVVPYDKYMEIEDKFKPYFLAEVVVWFPFGAIKLIEVTDINDDPVDITGGVVYLTVKRKATNLRSVIEKNTTDHGDLTTPVSGLCEIALLPADTKDLIGIFLIEVTLKTADDKWYTINMDSFNFIDTFKTLT